MTDPSESSDSVVEYDIFLSHSGKQKNFVEFLYYALRRKGRNPFFDKESLRKGHEFPPAIKKALRVCKVGVIVLSNEFLISRWPMMEMQWLVLGETEDSTATKILPLFFELSLEDLKSIGKLKEWQGKWREMPNTRTDRWDIAVEKLCNIDGIKYIKENGQCAYIEKVVSHMREFLPYNIPVYNPPLTPEHEELAQEIRRHFDNLSENEPKNNRKACVIGLHGEGHFEKPMCKRMVDVHLPDYEGKCCLIELPTDCDELKVVHQCKKALRLAELEGRALEGTDSFDQVVTLLKQHIPKFDVFIAIDNVCKGFSENIKRLWDVPFTASSRILLSSRSREVLRDILGTRTSYILSLPSSEHKASFDHVQKIEGPERSGHDWSQGLAAHQQVEYVIKGLQPIKKHMFLDIAVWLPPPIGDSHYTRTCTNALRWLLFFYKNLDKGKITEHIDELAAAGVIHKREDKCGQQMIGVDDLCLNLAQKEADRSPRFLTSTEKAVEEMEWTNLERVILEQPKDHRFIEGVERGQCRNVQFFYASEIDSRKICLKSMPGLSALILRKDTGRRKIYLNDLHKLEFLWLDGPRGVEGLDALVKLQVLCIRGCSRLASLDGLRCLAQLEAVDIHECNALKEVPNLEELTVLEKLTLRENKALEVVKCLSPALKEVSVEKCRALRKTPDLGAVSGLEKLTLLENSSLEEVGCPNPSLKELTVEKCHALKQIPNLGGVTGLLEKLTLVSNKTLEVVGPLGPALKEVKIEGCEALKKTPDLVSATGLEKLLLCNNESLEEVGVLGPSLKEVIVQTCDALKRMPGLEGATSLEKLTLRGNESLEKVGCLGPAVKEVLVGNCKALRRIPDLGGATRLRKLTLRGNESLEEVGCLSPALKELAVEKCKAVKRLPDLGGVTGLEDLTLRGNESLEEVGSLSPALKRVAVENCKALKRIPDLVGATGLKELRLCYNESLEEVACQSPALKTVLVRECGALTQLAGLDGVSGLETLMLRANKSLKRAGAGYYGHAIKKFVSYDCPGFRSENVLHLRGEGWTEEEWKYLERLRHLKIEECPTMRGMVGVGQLTELRRLKVRRCAALEEIWELGKLRMLEEVVLCECERLEDPRGDMSALRRIGTVVAIDRCPGLE